MLTLNYPLNIQVETTENCNQSCFYCYNYWRTDDPSRNNMSLGHAKELVDIIARDVRPFSTTITGGEPIMNMPATLVLVEGLARSGKFFNINSNLTLLTEGVIQKLKSAAGGKRFGIMTSLPSHHEDLFQRITGKSNSDLFFENLRNIIGNHPELFISVNMVVHKMNIDIVYEEGMFLAWEYGLKNFAATPMLMPSLRESQNMALNQDGIVRVLRTLIKLQKDTGMKVDSVETIPRCLMPEDIRYNDLGIFKRTCSAGRSTLSIGYDGSTRACSHSPFSAGNIFTDGFYSIWNEFRPFRENVYVPEECMGCVELGFCNGGCRFNGYQNGDPLNLKDSRMVAKVEVKPIENKPAIDFSPLDFYTVNPNSKYREERPGLFSFFNGDFASILFVNESFKGFILEIEKLKRLRFDDLGLEGEVRKKAAKIFKILIEKKYLNKEGEELSKAA